MDYYDPIAMDRREPQPGSKQFEDCTKAADLWKTGTPTTKRLVLDEVYKRSTGFKDLFTKLAF